MSPVIPIGTDSWIEQQLPNAAHPNTAYLSVNGSGADGRKAYVFFKEPFQLDDVIDHAYLDLYAYGALAGTLTAKRITEPWQQNLLTWNNQPAVSALNAASVSLTGLTTGQRARLVLTAMMADVAAGAPFYGVELSLDAGTTTDKFFVSANNGTETLRPHLDIDWTSISEPPDNLSPGGGLAVSVDQPDLMWQWQAEGLLDEQPEQAYSQVQISTNDTFTAIVYDSGEQPNIQSSWAMSGTAYHAPTDGSSLFWRVRVRDTAGNLTDWSDYAEFVVVPLGAVTMANPPAGVEPVVVDSLTPDIDWAVPFTQESAEVIITKISEDAPDDSDDVLPTDPNEQPEPADIRPGDNIDGDVTNPAEGSPILEQTPPEEVWRFPKALTAGTTVTVPEDILDRAGVYEVSVQSTDDTMRDAINGDPGYSELKRQFVYRPAGGVTPVTDLWIEQVGPMIILHWTYADVLNYFSLRVDGKEKRHRILPGDVRVGGAGSNTFELKWWHAKPFHRHKYVIEAVNTVGGKHVQSKGNKRRYWTVSTTGIWLCDPSKSMAVRIRGTDTPDMSFREVGNTYDIPGSKKPRRIIDSVGGYSGSVTGFVMGMKARNKIEEIKDRSRKREMRLIFSDYNIPVVLEEVSLAPSADLPPGNRQYPVTVNFFQVDDFPF